MIQHHLLFFIYDDHSYPKGLIVAFKLKSKSDVGSTEQNDNHEADNGNKDNGKIDGEVKSIDNVIEETEQKDSENVVNDEKDSGEKKDDSGEKPEESSLGSEEKEIEDGEKSSSPSKEAEVKTTGEKKSTAAAYKEDMNVVMREDLKGVFQKYGTVKVS